MPTALINGLAENDEVVGSGPPLLFVNGSGPTIGIAPPANGTAIAGQIPQAELREF